MNGIGMKVISVIIIIVQIIMSTITTQTHQEPVDITTSSTHRSYEYRLTSYWTDDSTNSGSCTNSGLCTWDFNVNERGWYTYDNKLVLAGATTICLESKVGNCGKWNEPLSNKLYFNLHDEVVVVIDDVYYDGIILDSCGSCMYLDYEDRIDLFISGKQHFIDRGYQGNNTITLIPW